MRHASAPQGFCAGILGTSLSNGLLALRQKVWPGLQAETRCALTPRPAGSAPCQQGSVACDAWGAPGMPVQELRQAHVVGLVPPQMDPNFKVQNEPPHVLWNAFTWAAHMGVSSNLRCALGKNGCNKKHLRRCVQ